jgi:hypothetical protein
VDRDELVRGALAEFEEAADRVGLVEIDGQSVDGLGRNGHDAPLLEGFGGGPELVQVGVIRIDRDDARFHLLIKTGGDVVRNWHLGTAG